MKKVFHPTMNDGHKVFVAQDGSVLLADASGATPDETEDGPLVVDVSKPAWLGLSYRHRPEVMIPVLVTRTGREGAVFTTADTAMAVKKHAPDLQIQADQGVQQVLSAINALAGTTPADVVAVPIDKLITLVGLAQDYVNDIETGIEEGTYAASDNSSLAANKTAVGEVQSLVFAAVRAKSPSLKSTRSSPRF